LARFFSRSTRKWLYVGLGVKRWLALLFIGVTLLGLGFAYILVDLYRTIDLPDIFYYLTLQFISRTERALLFGVLALACVVIALYKLSQVLLAPFVGDDTNVVDRLYRQRARKRGPKIVALGGGTGLSTLLRGLKDHTDQLTAILTVADDGGSSGKLRRELGVLPPGDFRQCIAAMADSEPLMSQLFQYRFGTGAGLDGHAFGNLFIAAMAGVTGSFERAIVEAGRVLAVRGNILPSTLENVTLCADVRDDAAPRVAGESAIAQRGKPIERVYLEPEQVSAYPGVVRAILDAEIILAGPGSLYTSVLPNLLVQDVQRALATCTALKIYICNVATQPGETDSFSVEDHYDALASYAGAGIFSHVLANNNFDVGFPEHSSSQMVRAEEGRARAFEMIAADVVDESKPWRHDPKKLAREILKLYNAKSKGV
ncbi:MAG: uridine diphosphate-N-acetylglucosamine-binding protein YvcK, partial [Chloroflexi bacterium]|nr:uridine diphosphate-N-acetylglucosamine-binding protein YvcK [Chloroflexota bacterium]